MFQPPTRLCTCRAAERDNPPGTERKRAQPEVEAGNAHGIRGCTPAVVMLSRGLIVVDALWFSV
eukprot:363029-Chlamydomonas_euryale.AAC.8